MGFIGGTGCLNVDIIYSGVGRLPTWGEEVFAKRFGLYFGGGVPGTLVNTQRLGVPSRLLTYLGNGEDSFTCFARRSLQQFGLEVVDLYHGSEITVNVSAVAVGENDRAFLTYGLMESTLFNGHVELEEQIYQQLRGAAVVDMHADFLSVYQRLHAEGTKLVFDTGWEDDLSIEKYRDYLEIADYYLPNRKEAMKITGSDTIEGAAESLSKFFRHVIIKLDREGCLLKSGEKIQLIPSLPHVVNVDSTGAGDAFMSGFLFGLYHHYDVEDCIRCGNVMGSVCVSQVGCITGSLTERELLQKFEEYYNYRPCVR